MEYAVANGAYDMIEVPDGIFWWWFRYYTVGNRMSGGKISRVSEGVRVAVPLPLWSR